MMTKEEEKVCEVARMLPFFTLHGPCAVTVKFSGSPALVLRHAPGWLRNDWEIRLPPDWLSTVYEHGLAGGDNPEHLLVLKARPLRPPAGADACWRIVWTSRGMELRQIRGVAVRFGGLLRLGLRPEEVMRFLLEEVCMDLTGEPPF